MNRILQSNESLSSVCSKSVVAFIQSCMVFDTLSNCEGCLTLTGLSEAKPPPPPYNGLTTVLVKLQFLVNRLVFLVN